MAVTTQRWDKEAEENGMAYVIFLLRGNCLALQRESTVCPLQSTTVEYVCT